LDNRDTKIDRVGTRTAILKPSSKIEEMLTKKTTTKINNTSQGIRIVGATQTLTTFKTTLEICKTWTEQNSKGSLCRFYLNLWAPTLQETQLS